MQLGRSNYGLHLELVEAVGFLTNLLVLFLFLLPASSSSSPSFSLSRGSSLSVENSEDVLTSPNGVFTAGFFPVGINAYCFAIWFTEPLNHSAVVWMANREHPVNGKRSKLSLRKDGNLILTDANQFTSWATNTAAASSSLVQLLLQNEGNLVLRAKDDILWQSFDFPTDTLLPEQVLTRYTRLISSRSQSNYSSGFYELFFDDDNVLRLLFDGPETSSIYWPDPWLLPNEAGRSRYNDTRTAVLDSLGRFHSSDRAEFWANDFGAGIQRRLTLNFDGNLRIYSLDKNQGIWIASGQAIFNPCRIHGACGSNSLCSYDHNFGRKCSCLHGHTMKNPMDWSYGCEPEFKLLCGNPNVTFVEYPYSDFYGSNINIFRNCTLKVCKRKCLESCECKGFQYRFNGENGVGAYDCYLKRRFRNGFREPAYRGVLHVKLPKEFPFPVDEKVEKFSLDCSMQSIKILDRTYRIKHDNGYVLARILLWFAFTLGGLEVICIIVGWLFLHRSNQVTNSTEQQYRQLATGFRKFSYTELKKATKNFSEEIGRGSSGVVYKGILCDHRVAAIKRLNGAKQNEAEMLAELSIIGRLNHMNLIDIWGYCAEGKHRLLVSEYLEHGSLAENLYLNSIDWKKRFDIALGTAKGLAYLHEECLEWVLHCDVKPHNILLDSNYQPKLADFGLSKLLKRADNDSCFSKIRGTRGYMAPEWIFNLPITSKVDVYSYGVVLLEMVTGRRPTVGAQTSNAGGCMAEEQLVKMVKEKVNLHPEMMASLIDEILDPNINCECDKGKMEILVRVALKCTEEDRDARPSMSQVVEMLQVQCDENSSP